MAELDKSYTVAERARGVRWKLSTTTLPEAARHAAQYVNQDGEAVGPPVDYCLPAEYAALNLLPEVRDLILDLFVELQIPWQSSVPGVGPTNHLMSSQVQCANALGQMVLDPARIRDAFGPVLGTHEVMQIEPGRYLTFEYIGDVDYFGEAPGGDRTRGSMCTSVDAAFLHRTDADVVELVLVEWKYTESYRKRTLQPRKDATRLRRYGPALQAADGALRSDLMTPMDLLDEPFYQLMRQQLLAYELEKANAHGAQRVRVVHVCPKANLAYQASLHRDTQLAFGPSVSDVWQRLLRRPDRFVSVDSAMFLDAAITSTEYVARYGDAE